METATAYAYIVAHATVILKRKIIGGYGWGCRCGAGDWAATYAEADIASCAHEQYFEGAPSASR